MIIMIISILNWIGSFCVIYLTIEISKKQPNLLLINILSFISCIIMIYVFINYKNIAMISQYIFLLLCSIRGIKNNKI